jgi:hypothetical protein
MENNAISYIRDAFRAVEIMRTNVGMSPDCRFAVVFPQHALDLMDSQHLSLLRSLSIDHLSDIGRTRPEEGFRYRICGMEFYGLFIHHEATLTRYELDYLLSRLRHAKEGTVFMGEFHQEMALEGLIERAEESGFTWVNERTQKSADIYGVGEEYKQIVTDMMWDFR